jgi:predicted SAM-dependent methyltransferase
LSCSGHNQTNWCSTDDRNTVSYRYLQGQGIEIGALHNPLPVKDGVKVKYVDRLSLAVLKKHYPELSAYTLTEIDIIDDGEILNSIQDNSLDFIIANHFLEHCENPLGTIKNHIKKIKTNGILYYAIPDKRYTFDKDRPLTDFNHFISDDVKGSSLSREQHFIEWVSIVENYKDTDQIKNRVSVLTTMNYSIHYHVWDIETAYGFLFKAREYLNNQFRVNYFEQRNNEIIIVLQKVV